MATKQRHQNPLVGDTVQLKFFIFNNGEYTDPVSIEEVNIYRLYGTTPTDVNPLGETYVQTITGDDIIRDSDGKYHVDIVLESPLYTQGRYQDQWNVIFEPNSSVKKSSMDFLVSPGTWFTDSMPIVHSFNFDFRPNRLTKGSKQYLEVQTIPDVPRGTDKQRYYENMAAAGELFISIAQKCGDCVPDEDDLKLIVDRECIVERDGCTGFYFLDTSDLNCGIYDVWFEAHLGPNVFVSNKEALQIYN